MRQQSAKHRARRPAIEAAQNAAMARDGHRCQAPERARPRQGDSLEVAEAKRAAAAVVCAGQIVPHHKASQRAHPEWAAKQWNIVTLCDAHHTRWVHLNLAAARLLGLYGAPDFDDIPSEDTP